MRLKLSPKASRRFRLILIIAGIIGAIAGLIIPAVIPSLRTSALIWIFAPIILASFGISSVIGFYLTFLNKASN